MWNTRVRHWAALFIMIHLSAASSPVSGQQKDGKQGIPAGDEKAATQKPVDLGNGPAWLRSIFVDDEKAQRLSDRWRVKPENQDVTILGLDHRTGSWAVYRWDHKRKTLNATPDVFTTATGVPTISLAKGVGFLRVVTDTNPFLYSAPVAVYTARESDDLAKFKMLAKALGGTASAVLAESSKAAKTQFAQGEAAGQDLERQALVTESQKLVTELRMRVESLQTSAAEVESRKVSIRQFVQELEFGQAEEPSFTPKDIDEVKVRSWLQTLRDVEVTRDRLQEPFRPCWASWKIVHDVVFSAGQDVENEATVGLGKLSELGLATLCSQEETLGYLDRLRRGEGKIENRRKTLQKDARLALVHAIIAADTLMAASNIFFSALSYVTAFREIASDGAMAVTTKNEELAWDAEMLRKGLLVLPRDELQPEWGKIYKSTLAIAASDRFCTDCARDRRADIANREFEVQAGGNRALGIGFGVVYTSLTQPVWDASTNPQNKDQKVIAVTDQEARAGQVALFATYKPSLFRYGSVRSPWLQGGVDVGAGLNTSKPAFYVGGSFTFFNIARLGIGETFQIIKVLDGQHAMSFRPDGTADPNSLTVVSSASDIRKRNGVSARLYVSLVLAIEGLPFFEPDN